MRLRIALVALAVLVVAPAFIRPSSSSLVSQAALVGTRAPSVQPYRAIAALDEATTTTTATTAPTTTTTTTPRPPPSTTTTAPPPPPDTAPALAGPPPSQWDGTVEGAVRYWFPDNFGSAWRVSDCESGHDPSAVSPGGGNYGLFQINSVHGSDFEAVTGQPWSSWSSAFYNSQYARHLYEEQGWGPWTCKWAA